MMVAHGPDSFGLQEWKYLTVYFCPLLFLPVLVWAVRNLLCAVRGIIQFGVLVWTLVALIQTFVNPDSFTFLLGSWANMGVDIVSSGRGVVGLAPEPWYHACHVILLSTVLGLLGARWPWIALGILDALMLAKSTGGAACLFAGCVIGVFSLRWDARNRGFALLGCLALCVGCWALLTVDSTGRFGQLTREIISDPWSVVLTDHSANVRVAGVYASLWLFANSWGTPVGIGHVGWLMARDALLDQHPWMIDLSLVGPASGLGTVLFQGGFLAMPMFLVLGMRFLRASGGFVARSLASASLVVVICQFSLVSGAFWLVYACLLASTRTACGCGYVSDHWVVGNLRYGRRTNVARGS